VAQLPERLPAGAIELCRWRPEQLDDVLAAIAVSLTELHRWMPWAQRMPSAPEQLAVLEAGELNFDTDREWNYVLYEIDTGELAGGAGLHPRVGPGGAEIGYWVRSDRTGRGYATSAARALTEAAFTYLHDLERVEIHMDQANGASAAVARKLGYRLDREEDRMIEISGDSGRGYVWVLERSSDPQ